jgi:hypothetical protein
LWQVADSSKLYGCFKIAIAQAKREYIQQKPQSTRRFVPSDIVPLMSMAWEESFARSDRARKAIHLRGWGTLVYILSKDPRLNNINPTETPRMTNNNLSPDLSTINTEGPTITSFVDLIPVEKLKDDGRRQLFETERERRKEEETRVEKLKK